MTRQCNLNEAKAKLSELVQAALDGEDVLITRAGKAAVRLVPVVVSGQSLTKGWGSLEIDARLLDAAFAPDLDEDVARLLQGPAA